MKAYVCREFGPVESHKVEEIEDPRAEAGQVRSKLQKMLKSTS